MNPNPVGILLFIEIFYETPTGFIPSWQSFFYYNKTPTEFLRESHLFFCVDLRHKKSPQPLQLDCGHKGLIMCGLPRIAFFNYLFKPATRFLTTRTKANSVKINSFTIST